MALAEDAVVAQCVAQGGAIELCECASTRLENLIGAEDFAHFNALTSRLEALIAGAAGYRGEYFALLQADLLYSDDFAKMQVACQAELDGR